MTVEAKQKAHRFVCVPCKTELVFNAGVPYAEANERLGKLGWRIAFVAEPLNYWTLCCPKCMDILQ